MGATSRALGALALTTSVLLPALPATALPGEDPGPAPAVGTSSGLTAATPSGTRARILLQSPAGSVAAPGIAADSWLVADLESGAILAAQNPDLAVRPASTLKLLTALTVAPRLSPDQPYRAVQADEVAEGNRVVLYEGLEYTVSDLLHAALLPSANDAAEALARANGGVEATVGQMNVEAARLGASSTTARNPSGLDEDGQTTTARDMALIGRAAFDNPEIADYLKLRVVDFPGKMANGNRVIYPIYNHNRMLAHTYFEGALGGKSGYTSKAGRTFVAAAERDGRRLLVTLFRIGGNTYTSAEVLLDWAFANVDRLQPIGTLAEPSSPAPTFDRTITPLPVQNRAPRAEAVPVTDDAPTARARAEDPATPAPRQVPSPLTLLTALMAVVVVLRARVYWRMNRAAGSRPTRAGSPPTAAPSSRTWASAGQQQRRDVDLVSSRG